jgi:hypothetical protein
MKIKHTDGQTDFPMRSFYVLQVKIKRIKIYKPCEFGRSQAFDPEFKPYLPLYNDVNKHLQQFLVKHVFM